MVPILPAKLQRLLDDYGVIDDPHERLAAVVDRAKHVPPLGAADRIDAHRVLGCVSVVWLVSEIREGRCHFRTDAESPLVRGLVTFLGEFFSGASAPEVAACPLDPLEALGLTRNLSPTRRNGLAATGRAIREFARTHLSPTPGDEP